MQSIIDVFRMDEVSSIARAEIIIKLGKAINHQQGMNITESLVYELVKILEPTHPIINDEHYRQYIGFDKKD